MRLRNVSEYGPRNGRLFNLKESIPSFLQDIMIDIQFILLTICYIIVWYRMMPLFSSEHVNWEKSKLGVIPTNDSSRTTILLVCVIVTCMSPIENFNK